MPKNYQFPFDIEFEELSYHVEHQVSINSLLFKSKEQKGLVFYIHGNADNLRYWGDYAKYFVKHGYDVFMYDYRGFGKSDGKIKGEKSLQKDAKLLYLKMAERYAEENIIIYGFSIGTGIASRLASNHEPKHLILEAPYYNFVDLAKFHRSYLPVNLISKYHFRTNKYLPSVEAPITIFHGTEDQLVPFYSGAKLKGLNENLNFIPIQGATHSDMQEMEQFDSELRKILS